MFDCEDPDATPVRTPPCALDSEGACLAASMERKDACDSVCAVLRSKDFYSEANRWVFNAVKAIHESGALPDVFAVKEWLERRRKIDLVDPDYLNRHLAMQPYVADLWQHIKNVRHTARLRSLIHTCQQIAAEGYGDCGDVQAFIDKAEQAIYHIANDGVEQESIRHMRDSVRELFDVINKDIEAKEKGILCKASTGLTRLDGIIGGLRNGSLVIVAARPSIGKTALMLNMASHIASKATTPRLGVHVISMETRHTSIAARVVCTEARQSVGSLWNAAVKVDDWPSLMEASQWASGLPITTDDRSGLSVAQLRASIRRAQAMHRKVDDQGEVVQKLGAVFVDYLQLASDAARKGGNREQEVTAIAYGLLGIAKDFDVPVVALSQLNRAVENRPDKRPKLADLRESGGIEQAADVVVGLYRDEYYNEQSDDCGIAECIVLKSKDTATGTAKVAFRKEWMMFSDLEENGWEGSP